MDRKGGILTSIIVLIVVFFVGMFAGYSILTKFFGEEVADTLSPEIDISQEDLIKRCGEAEIKNVICGVGLLGGEGGIGIEDLAVGLGDGNESGNESL